MANFYLRIRNWFARPPAPVRKDVILDPHCARLYGIVAEFNEPDDLLRAAERTHLEGYRKVEAYTPFPVDGLAEHLGHHGTAIPLIVLMGGLMGCFGGYFLQYYIAAIEYPTNIGGRPFNSWPAFIPVTFECTVLIAALTAFFGMLALNGLPEPYHPMFNLRRFALASRDRFFLCIETTDPKFNRDETTTFLKQLDPVAVNEVQC
ncbi:MAG: DUF3341 domain-containing protein [Acidobacteria bacterium]|nr:MAG: DUF3341 domain-containing protein [Acidobacteriota bacterium]